MKFIFFIFIYLVTESSWSNQQYNQQNNFECFSETSVSGLFQNKKKFLKETEFFPNKTILNFSEGFKFLTERENTVKEETEAKYQFKCTKENKHSIYFCTPFGLGLSSEYSIKFSLATMRFRKSVITDYWLNGKGNEVDYVHIAHGYCYDID